MFSVAEIMTRQPYTLGPDDKLQDARNLMAEHHIRHVPIVGAEDVLIGVVSQRDVLAASGSSLGSAETATGGEATAPLSSVMTSPVQSIDESASLRGTALHLQKNKLGCLPVLRDSKLVGIVTDSDFVTVAINLMEQLETLEPEEIELGDEDEFMDPDQDLPLE